jgi:hypothetical protein
VKPASVLEKYLAWTACALATAAVVTVGLVAVPVDEATPAAVPTVRPAPYAVPVELPATADGATVRPAPYAVPVALATPGGNVTANAPTLKAIVERVTGQGSTAQIPRDKYDQVCIDVQTYKLAVELDGLPFE